MTVGAISERARSNLAMYSETPAEERRRRVSEKAARTKERREAEARRNVERKRRELNRHVTVTWLFEPVRLHPRSRVMVVGVCSDAADDVRATYGVR